MPNAEINYNNEDINKLKFQVDNYNKLPESERENNLKFCNSLMPNKIFLAKSDVDIDPQTGDIQAGKKYQLIVVPEWADDLDELKQIPDKYVKAMFNNYYNYDYMDKPFDMWHSDVKLIIRAYDYKHMIATNMTLEKFIKEIINNMLDDFDMTLF